MKKQNLYLSIAIIILAGVAVALLMRRPVQNPNPSTVVTDATATATNPAAPQDFPVSFICDDNKSIAAVFHLPADQTLDITVSDGRSTTLNHVTSVDGARYASPDGSVVFWSKGQGAFLQEGTVTTYANCRVATTPAGTAAGT